MAKKKKKIKKFKSQKLSYIYNRRKKKKMIPLRRLLHTASSASTRNTLCEEYRNAMKGIASSANIITTNHNLDSSTYEPRGLTVSSLTSLSISPDPLISFNLQLPSRTSEVLKDSGIFAINVLPALKESVDLCRAFAGALGPNVNPFEKFSHHFDYCEDEIIIPSVKFANSIIYCKPIDLLKVQDHEIWVAKVYKVDHRSDKESSVLYQNRAFHFLGNEID